MVAVVGYTARVPNLARSTSGSQSALLALVLVLAGLGPAAAQAPVRVDGTIQAVFSQTLTLVSDAPISGQVMISPSLVPVPAPRPSLTVDLGQLPPGAYAFVRPGERISVIGVVSNDGRRVIATAIIRGPEPQLP